MKGIFYFLVFFIIGHIATAQLSKEQESIKKIFFDFLNYYRDNEAKFYSFKLYKGTGKEDGPPYQINWKEVEKYFSWLRKNVPYVGEEYIKNERNDFKFYDSCFKEDPEEEMPMGFDYDRWTGSQEDVSYMIEWYTSPKNKFEVIIKGNKARLRIGAELWEGDDEKNRGWSVVDFVKEKGKWKMAANIYPVDNEMVPDN
jgi:hypothetical protein